MVRARFAVIATLAACSSSSGLDQYFPPLPPPTHDAQQVFVGEITDASQLVTGPAQSGVIGDFYIKNDRATFIVQAPTRVIGVIPQGGNLVDAVLTDGDKQIVDDHFGELGLVYVLGRTCQPDRIEIVRDGSGGGVAAIRARGKTANDDFINLKGIGVLPVDATVDPDIDDGVECATTYVLAPGSTTLEVYHSLYNAGKDRVDGPMGTIADTGGNTEVWTNTRGFERADISAIASLGQAPSDYVVYQGPGVAYGVIPRHAKPTPHTQVAIAGVSVILDGNDTFLDILQKDKYYLHLTPGQGLMQRYDVVVGRDASDVDAVWRTYNGETLAPITGKVTFADGTPAVGARVGVFVDGNGNGVLDDETVVDETNAAVDHAVLYMDTGPDGTYAGQVPTAAGNLLVRAEVKNVGRSQAMPAADTVNLAIPSPLKVDFQIVDADTGQPIPGRLVVIGDHPAFPDNRLFEIFDRSDGVVTQEHAIRGTTVDVGDGTDPAIYLPAGGTYRIYASRGTEWSIDSKPVTASGSYTFTLKHVVPTPGYLATDWHVHMLGSPDSPVTAEDRVSSAVSGGVEIFAATDHDYVTDLEPLVQQWHLDRLLRVVPGMEVTPFAYGHFNCWPLVPDASANRGAIDWAQGAVAGDAMIPDEIFSAMRAKGAQMVQVNHPRATGFGEFQAAFTRANVKYDFDNHTIYGDYENADVPNDYLRLPGQSLWSDHFNGLEIWNGFTIADSNGDGVRENKNLDRVMHDWLSMLSLGFFPTPAGDSDTHTVTADPLGMPRTFVRVSDDSADAIASGSAIDDVLATQTGASGRARDIVVTDGPMIDVEVAGTPSLGATITSIGQPVTFDVTVTAADWAPFDTLEVFANSTPDPVGSDDNTVLVPLKCYTSRPLSSLAANDPCMQAPLAPEAMTVQLVAVSGAGSYQRYQATVAITLDPSDITTRPGAIGKDAWFVFRARGDRGIFPLLEKSDTVTPATMPALMSGDRAAIDAALAGHGIPAEAVTSPVFVDFDGGGYRAPFAP